LVSSHKFPFRVFATVSSGLWLVNKKNPVVSVISDCIGKCQTQGQSIRSVNVVWPSQEPTVSFYLINIYFRYKRVLVAAVKAWQSGLQFHHKPHRLWPWDIKNIALDHEASCSNGGHGVAQQESRPWIPGYVDRTERFDAPQIAASFTASFGEAAPLNAINISFQNVGNDKFSLRISDGHDTSSFIKIQKIL